MSISTVVARLPAEGDSRHGRPSGVLVDERPSRLTRGRDRGKLFILVEVSGQPAGRNVIANQLASAVRQTYYDRPGSVTSGLQDAIREANRLLYDDNRNSLPGERRTAGISCVVLRASSSHPEDGGDLYIAQAGPTAVYLAQQGEVTRFPDISPWLDGFPAEDLDAAALGERRDLDVSLFHIQVRQGDTFVLVDSILSKHLAPGTWKATLMRDSVAQIMQTLQEAGAGEEAPVVAVRLDGAAMEPSPGTPATPEATPVPSKTAVQPAWQQISERVEQLEIGDRLRTAAKVLAAALSSVGLALLTFVKRLIPGQTSSQPTEDVQAPVVKESAVKPERRRAKAAPKRERSGSVRRVLLGVAIAIPVLVAAVVLITYWQRGQSQRAEIDNLWVEADRRWQQALQTSDPAALRTLLTESDSYLTQLLERQPERAEATELKERVGVLLDELNQVRRITWTAELNSYPSGADLSRVIVEGVHVFVMDRNAGKVYHHQLDEPQQALQADSRETVLVSKGDQVGNVLVNDLVDMTWMPTDYRYRKESLVILESGGSLLQYDPATGELIALPVTGSETWQNPQLIGGHTGRFYLLDPAANKIWRYSPTADGYTDPPDDWLQSQIDLIGVEDMSIGDSVYLLYADGKIRKLSTGNTDAFDISDWDSPPQNPSSIFTRPPDDAQWLYVADRGNSRIVQSSKEGLFKRQFRLADPQTEEGGDPLGSVTSLFVDEIGGRAYFLSGRSLYLVILPD